ncbi:MAG: UvrB/UvrC motif-containing protein, partial [Nitrospira sp.]|nr:UvrB/UvrC motif-containing protein [Nitrospira sp.]
DIPEVSLVAILDADKEGYLRSHTSLIQTTGRAARNVHGEVIMYADNITASMKSAIDETNRRRKIQMEYNQIHRVTPQTIQKEIHEGLYAMYEADYYTVPIAAEKGEAYIPKEEIPNLIQSLEREMREAARRLEFERAAELRDRIKELKEMELEIKTRLKA